MDLSVVIVSYKDKRYIPGCVKSIRDTVSKLDYEIVIVKNDFETFELSNQADIRKRIIIKQNDANLGFSKGVNIGITGSGGKYVLLLNSDTVAGPGAINYMFDYMETNAGVAICGPRLLNADGSLQLSCKGNIKPPARMMRDIMLNLVWPRNKITDRHLISYEAHNLTHEVDCLKGACLFARRSSIDGAGLLDEQFFMFGEEFDWCMRMASRGWKIVYLAEPTVVHFGGGSSGKDDDKILLFNCDVERFRSLFKLYKKYYGKKGFNLFKLLTLCELFIKLINNFFKQFSSRNQKKHDIFFVVKRYMRLIQAVNKVHQD